jgi:hypothetical protein
MTEPDQDEFLYSGQSELYRSVANAYRNAQIRGGSENDCHSAAVRAVKIAHPFFLQQEAEQLARRILLQFSELYPEWLSNKASPLCEPLE